MIKNYMTEVQEMCPSCKTKIDLIINPENIAGNSICMCSNCMALVVIENGKLRKMRFREICSQYHLLIKQYNSDNLDTTFIKLKWVTCAMVRMRTELARLN